MTSIPSDDSLAVSLASESDLAAWQDFADGREDAGPMHHAGWYGVLRDAFNAPPHFLLVRDGHGCVRGILPMYRGHSFLTGTHYSSLEGGALAETPDARSALLEAATSLREEPGIRYVQIRGRADEAPFRAVKVHSIVATSVGPDAAWRAVRERDRRYILAAEKQGITIARDDALLDPTLFYGYYAKRMRELGTPVFGRRLFGAICAHLGPGRVRLYILRHRHRCIGGALCISHGRRWTNLYSACDRDAPNGANKLQIWQVIRDAAVNGVLELDLGRSVPGGGVHDFKRKMGGRDVEMTYGFYPARRRRLDSVLFAQSGKTPYQKLWSRLPLPLCNWAGPAIRSGLPFL